MSRTLSPELALIAACCRWPLGKDARDAIDDAVGRGIDWPLFERVVRRNRVLPLVSAALTSTGVALPASLARRFAEGAQECARRGLLMARESLHLQRAFDGAGIPLRIIKGTPLAVLAYGELGLKESWDIDLLVQPEDVPKAIGLLAELGYRGELTEARPRELEAHVTYGKEAQFSRTAPSVTAELHWRLADNACLLRGVDASGRSESVSLPGGELRTLPDKELLVYLAVHGTFHNWSRLKWLADFGALISRRGPFEIAEFCAAAKVHGAARCAAVTLLLCRELLGLSLEDRLVRELRDDRVARILAENAIAGLAHGRGATEMKPYSWPWLRMMTTHFLAPEGPARVEQFRSLWNAPDYRSATALPPGLEFGYHFLRMPLWLWRVSMRALQRSRA